MFDILPFIIILLISLSAFAVLVWVILRLANWQHERIMSYWRTVYPFEKKIGTRWGYVADIGEYSLSLETFAGLKVPYRVGNSAISLGRSQGYRCILRPGSYEGSYDIPAKRWWQNQVHYPEDLPAEMREPLLTFDQKYRSRPAIKVDEEGYSFVLGQVASMAGAKRIIVYMKLLEELRKT